MGRQDSELSGFGYIAVGFILLASLLPTAIVALVVAGLVKYLFF